MKLEITPWLQTKNQLTLHLQVESATYHIASVELSSGLSGLLTISFSTHGRSNSVAWSWLRGCFSTLSSLSSYGKLLNCSSVIPGISESHGVLSGPPALGHPGCHFSSQMGRALVGTSLGDLSLLLHPPPAVWGYLSSPLPTWQSLPVYSHFSETTPISNPGEVSFP